LSSWLLDGGAGQFSPSTFEVRPCPDGTAARRFPARDVRIRRQFDRELTYTVSRLQGEADATGECDVTVTNEE
jgi:hypothetical protein